MANFKDIIKLSESDGGKVFVVDESGDVKLIMLSVVDYQKLLLGKLKAGIMDVESINQAITNAQLEDSVAVADLPKNYEPKAGSGHKRVDLRSEVIDPDFNFEAPPGEEYEPIKPDFEDI